MKKLGGFQLKNILTVSFAHFFHDIYSSFLAPILPLLIDKFNISYTLAGLLSVFQRFPSLFNPVIGYYIDKTNIRFIVIFAPLVTAISMSLLGIAPHYAFIAILLFVMGISSAFFHVPAPVMIKHVAGRHIGKGMSYYMLGGEAARTIGPIIILGAVSLWGLKGTWRLIPFAIGVSSFLFFRLKNNKTKVITQYMGEKGIICKTIKNILPFFSIVGGIIFFRSGMKSALTVFLPIYLTTRGFDLWLAGVSLAILQFSGALGTFFVGTISDRIGRKNALLMTTIIPPILLLLLVSQSNVFTIPTLILIGFFLFGSGPVLLALVQDINSDQPSFINGIFMTINFIISSLSILMVGFLGDVTGFDNTYKISAILAMGSIPLVLMLKQVENK